MFQVLPDKKEEKTCLSLSSSTQSMGVPTPDVKSLNSCKELYRTEEAHYYFQIYTIIT